MIKNFRAARGSSQSSVTSMWENGRIDAATYLTYQKEDLQTGAENR